jgi:site-specific DNA-adenine methylase
MSYPGAKGQDGVWQRIIGQMPPHSLYVEPFFGSGQIFHRKRRSLFSYLVDIDPAAIAKVGAVGITSGVTAICGDALKILPTLPVDSKTVIYCDPPYLLSTRKGRRYYKNELTNHDHATLVALLQALPCYVLLSGYPSQLYSSRLHGWRCLEYQTMTRGGQRRECLWCNFPEPEELHDWRFAGFNFRQRFGLKRFVRRWLARIERMPARRRGYVLHELGNAIAQRHGRSSGPHQD